MNVLSSNNENIKLEQSPFPEIFYTICLLPELDLNQRHTGSKPAILPTELPGNCPVLSVIYLDVNHSCQIG